MFFQSCFLSDFIIIDCLFLFRGLFFYSFILLFFYSFILLFFYSFILL
ncbi:membrane protein, partial [Helicobacter pylori PZ5024]